MRYEIASHSNSSGGRVDKVPIQRVNDSALGPLERPALAWLADRLPQWVTPDRLTLLGIAGSLAAAVGYCASHWSLQWLWLASAGLVVNWVGDSLDGTVARHRRIQRPRYGFFVDHTSDLFTQALVFLALGVSPCAHFGVACLGAIAFLMVFVYSLICVEVRHTMRVTYFGFGPTEIRVLQIVGNLFTLHLGVVDVGQFFAPLAGFGPVTVYEAVIVTLFTITVPTLLILALRERRELADEDPPRVPIKTGPVVSATAQAAPSQS